MWLLIRNCISRVIKTRSEKNADKAILPKLNDEFEEKAAALKEILVNKLLVLTDEKVFQGVKDYLGTEVIAKGAKFTEARFGIIGLYNYPVE